MTLVDRLQNLAESFLRLFLLFLNPLIAIPLAILIFLLVKRRIEYKKSAYYRATNLPYATLRRNKGAYGEFLIYKHLREMEAFGAKFLFNAYIPKETGETTEIDVLMICSDGIFVFESKNYSGWIHGSEDQRNWCQTLPAGRGNCSKEFFYNPVMQNRAHIQHLSAFLGRSVPFHSVIVFADRCSLTNVFLASTDVHIVHHRSVAPAVFNICNHTPGDPLSEKDISEIYDKLYPFTQATEITKALHVANIRRPARPVSPIVATADAEGLQSKPPVDEMPPAVTELPPAETPPITPPVCPRCNATLVLRTAKWGAHAGRSFWGCSRYPTCKYIQNIHNK